MQIFSMLIFSFFHIIVWTLKAICHKYVTDIYVFTLNMFPEKKKMLWAFFGILVYFVEKIYEKLVLCTVLYFLSWNMRKLDLWDFSDNSILKILLLLNFRNCFLLKFVHITVTWSKNRRLFLYLFKKFPIRNSNLRWFLTTWYFIKKCR